MSAWLLILAQMFLFSLLAIWLRAQIDVRKKGRHFSWSYFLTENFNRFINCGVGNVIISLCWSFDQASTSWVLEYLKLDWLNGEASAIGFAVGLGTVVMQSANKSLRSD